MTTRLSLRGAAGDVGVSPVGACLPTKTEILTSRAQHAPQNDRVGISTTHIVHNQILRYVYTSLRMTGEWK